MDELFHSISVVMMGGREHCLKDVSMKNWELRLYSETSLLTADLELRPLVVGCIKILAVSEI